MFIAALSCCLLGAFPRPALEIEVAPVKAIRSGEALELKVTLTYRGENPARVDTVKCIRPCDYKLPKSWGAVAKRDGGMMAVMVGPGYYEMDPGKTVRYTLRVSRDYDISPPPGDHEVLVQARLADELSPEGAQLLESRWVKVTVRVLPPE